MQEQVERQLTEVLHENFRDNVKSARATLGITQAELARRLGVSRPYVAEIEGGRHVPSLDVVDRFAKALKLDGHVLLLPPKKFSVAS